MGLQNDAEERTKEALSGFQLSAQYSEALAIVFITLTYCSAVPILMPFLAVCTSMAPHVGAIRALGYS